MNPPAGTCRRSRFFIVHFPCSPPEHANQKFPFFVPEHPALEAVRRPAVWVGCTLQGQHTSNFWEDYKARGNVRWHNAQDNKIHHHRIPDGVLSWTTSHDGRYPWIRLGRCIPSARRISYDLFWTVLSTPLAANIHHYCSLDEPQ